MTGKYLKTKFMQYQVLFYGSTFVCFGWNRRDWKPAIFFVLVMTYVKWRLFYKSYKLVAFPGCYCVLGLVNGDFLRFWQQVYLKH